MVWSLDFILRGDPNQQYAKGIIFESISRFNRYRIFLSQYFTLSRLFCSLHQASAKNEQFPTVPYGKKTLLIGKNLIKQKEILLSSLRTEDTTYVDTDCIYEELSRNSDYSDLNSYDGNYDTVDVDNETFYIMRTE
jgi:hypothetical protein